MPAAPINDTNSIFGSNKRSKANCCSLFLGLLETGLALWGGYELWYNSCQDINDHGIWNFAFLNFWIQSFFGTIFLYNSISILPRSLFSVPNSINTQGFFVSYGLLEKNWKHAKTTPNIKKVYFLNS